MIIGIDGVAHGLRQGLENSLESLAAWKKSGHLQTAVITAGLISLMGLGYYGCSGSGKNGRVSSNLQSASRAELLVPDKFEVLNDGRLYIRNFVASDVVVMDSKTSSNGVKYFQGTKGGDVLIPAQLDANGNVRYK